MGQRANYITIKNGKTKIYYTHWRANLIAKDLLLGKDVFSKFVERFEEKRSLLNYPWIEGFVILNFDKKELIFQEEEFIHQSSIIEAYLIEAQKKWKGWKVEHAKDGLYTLATEVDSGYINDHKDDFESSKVKSLKEENDCFILASILKEKNGKIKVHYFNDELDSFSMIGNQLLSFLKSKPSSSILNELEFEYKSVLYLDEKEKVIILGKGIPKLKEKIDQVWKGWKIEIREIGYLNFLKLAGIKIDELSLNRLEINNRIENLKSTKDNFDPTKFAKKMIAEGEDVKFHPNFFENVKPKKRNWINQLIKNIWSKE